MSPVIQLEEMERKALRQKIVFSLISFQKAVRKKMKQIEPELSQLLLPSPKTSLTACVTKPV